MRDRHFIYSREDLIKVVDALEVLNKHYLISSIDRESASQLRVAPRWIVEESDTGNPLDYDGEIVANG